MNKAEPGMKAFRRPGACTVLAWAVGTAWLAAGCGGEKLPAVDVAALNAELAQAESRLSDRLEALDPGTVEEACLFAASALEEGERTVEGLPEGDVGERVALAAALAQFRDGVEEVEGGVEEAAADEREARGGAVAELEVLRGIRRRFAEEVEPGLPEWAGQMRETEARLASWREQRLEKMSDGQFATFPSFHEGASARYREWSAWVERAGSAGTVACGELLPAARAAAERLAARAAEAGGARARVEEGIGALRAMPISQGLVATARKTAVAVFNRTIREAAVAMAKMEEATAGCPADVRGRAAALLAAANDLEKAAKGVSGDIREQMERGTVAAATAAAGRAREVHGEVTAGADEFEAVRDRLRQAWEPIGEQVQAAADAANEVQKMARTDEEALARDVALIESLRRRIEAAEIGEWCERLAAFPAEAAGKLSAAEAELSGAGDAYAAAMAAAARKAARSALGNLRASLDQNPAPGYKRPARKVKQAQTLIDGFLADMDAMGDDEFLAENGRVSGDVAKLVDEIVDQTAWTPGARHPDIPHIHASDRERTWANDPGYEFVDSSEGSTNLTVRWKPGSWNPDHPNVTAGRTEGSWVPDPGYKARKKGDLDPVWTAGERHPDKPHVFATAKEHTWDADPGYWFVRPGTNCDLVVRWEPGRRHPEHPYVSAGQTEGTWVPDPGYKARWNGDLDPRWTPGTRHPTKPHVFAMQKENMWDADPGYSFVRPGTNSDLTVRWEKGLRHPDYKGIESSAEENRWSLQPGWTWVNPGTSDLRARWVPGSQMPGFPHVHASDTEGKWAPDTGYRFRSMANDGDFSVEWVGR